MGTMVGSCAVVLSAEGVQAMAVSGTVVVAAIGNIPGDYDKFHYYDRLPDGGSETEPRENHNIKQQGKDIPKNGGLDITGEASSSTDLLDENGELKQRRYYDENGRAEKDIDYKHSNGDGSHTFPHEHYWDWSNPDKPHRN